MKSTTAIVTLSLAAALSPVTWAQESAKPQAAQKSGHALPLMTWDQDADPPQAADLKSPPVEEVDKDLTDSKSPSAEEIAKELANPNNSLASLTFKNQFRWYDGDLPTAGDQFNYTTLFQPVFPFTLGKTASGGKSNLFVRPAIPMLFDQPVPSIGADGFGFDDVTGIGDIGFDMAYGVSEPSGFIWALGMVGTLPTASSSLIGGKQLRLGPEFVVAQVTDWGILGIFPSHQWDVTGWGDGDFNTSQIQPVVRFLPGGGWSIGSAPIMQHNWETKEWTIPLNLTIGKTVIMGKTPVKIELDVNYYASSPSAFGPEWMVGINVTPVVSNFIEKLIRK